MPLSSKTAVVSAGLISILLSACGVALAQTWHLQSVIWPWVGLSVALITLVSHPQVRQLLADFATGSLNNAWVWLVMAVATSAGVFVFGHEMRGAVRHYGDVVQLRSGLWSVLFYALFLAQISNRRRLTVLPLGLAVVGSLLLIIALLAQPDYYSVLMLLVVCLPLIGSLQHHGARLLSWGILIFMALLGLAIFSAEHRANRLLAFIAWQSDDMLGLGFAARQIGRALAQAGWWGYQESPLTSAMGMLGPNMEWYSLVYLGLWVGNVLTFIAIFSLMVFAALICYLMGFVESKVAKQVVRGGVLVFIMNHLFATGASYGVAPLVGHYGVAFLSGGQMGVVSLLLLILVGVASHSTARTQ